MQGLGRRSKYSNAQNRSAPRVNGRMSRFTGIPRYCVSIFQFGLVFALFSRVKLSRLAKSKPSSGRLNLAFSAPQIRLGY